MMQTRQWSNVVHLLNGDYTAVLNGEPTFIPANMDSVEYRDLAAWIAAGGEVTEEAPRAPTEADVIAEREARHAAGFAYNFGDKRGVHDIGTTEADMKGWDVVTKGAAAAIALGAPTTEFGILTNTGAATVTAMEWQQIVAAATAWGQPIWHASFAIAADVADGTITDPDAVATDPRWP